jgi:thymidine phosphorylase
MLPQEIIRRKRDGAVLAEAEIADFVAGFSDGRVTDGQIAAFAMAVFFRGMTMPETVALTRAMTRSGEVLDWAGEALPGPILDKHSTGGVGDAVSLVLAPLVAACGGFVPMISGRGLGHTGGTLDKFESIPGYVAVPDLPRFRRVVREAGCAVIGQTGDLAPADRRFYAVRDVTATVEAIPLITASILSKKLAAGLCGLVMDVKTGSGAFLPPFEQSQALARSIAEVAGGAGLPTVALVTDMDRPLATSAGNAVEMREAIAILRRDRRDSRLEALTLALAAEMLVLGELAADVTDGLSRARAALDDGRAAERFARMVAGLGGPSDILERHDAHLAKAPVTWIVPAAEAGVVAAVDTRALGLVVVRVGGGRTRPQDPVDHAVGLTDIVELGAAVDRGAPLAIVHARTEADAATASAAVQAAIRIVPAGSDVAVPELVQARIAGVGLR